MREYPFILIIDDSLTVRKILEMCLRREGYEVRSFVDGVEALRWLASPQSRVPALILLDLILPRMDGLSVLRCLKRKLTLEAVPVVMLSRREGVLDRLKARLAGACAYVTKPFKREEVLAIVTRLLILPTEKETLSYTVAPTVEGVGGCSVLLQRLEATR